MSNKMPPPEIAAACLTWVRETWRPGTERKAARAAIVGHLKDHLYFEWAGWDGTPYDVYLAVDGDGPAFISGAYRKDSAFLRYAHPMALKKAITLEGGPSRC